MCRSMTTSDFGALQKRCFEKGHRQVSRNPKTIVPTSFSFFMEDRSWDRAWKSFAEEHSSWLNGFPAAEPIYLLPKETIRLLARRNPKGKRFILPHFVDSEYAFTALCEAAQGVGVWRGQSIQYGPMTNRQMLPFPVELLKAAKLSADQQLRLPEASRLAEEPRHRVLGVPGWLLTEPAFLAQTEVLKALWNALPSKEQSLISLSRTRPGTMPPKNSTVANTQLSAFLSQYEEFLDRWGLLRMATWDLPLPQGPLLPAPLPVAAAAAPTHGIHLVLPVHYRIQDNDGLVDKILDLQEQAVRQLGIDPSFAGLPHSEAYGQMFEILHLERAIRSRERPGNTLHGHGLAMEAAMASCIGPKVATVQKYRTAISACLRGERSKVRMLRPGKR
jgi:hypothetical protein